MMTVELHPDPVMGDYRVEALPPYLRPRPRLDGAGRVRTYWHRPRSASVYYPRQHSRRQVNRLCVHFWCGGTRQIELPPGQVADAVRFHFTDERPTDDLCASCDGRAQAYYEPDSPLAFAPRNVFEPPPWCPAQGIWLDGPARLCPLCGSQVRAKHGPYAYGVARHRPTEMTADPCPLHGWKFAAVYPNGVGCWLGGCDWFAPYGSRMGDDEDRQEKQRQRRQHPPPVPDRQSPPPMTDPVRRTPPPEEVQ